MTVRIYEVNGRAVGWRIENERTIRGKRIRKSVTRRGISKRDADRIDREMAIELDAMQNPTSGVGYTLSGLIRDYIWYSQNTKKTHADDAWRLATVMRIIGDIPVIHIGLDDLIRYQKQRSMERVVRGHKVPAKHGTIRARAVQPATVNREMSALSAAINYARRTNRLPQDFNPCRFLTPLRESGRIEYEVTDDDVIELCRGKADHVRRIILVARFTGLRMSAVCSLDWSQIGDDWIIRPNEVQAASRKRVGRIPVLPEIRPLLGARKKSGAVFTWRSKPVGTVHSAIMRSRKVMGRKIRFHDLRAAFNNALLRAGVDDIYRRELMGHSHGSVVQARYARVSDADLWREMGKIGGARELVAAVMGDGR